jgi:hypothetical protein
LFNAPSLLPLPLLPLQAASKGGQQLKAGLSAAGSASFKYLSQQYQSWRAGGQPQQQRDLDAAEVRTPRINSGPACACLPARFCRPAISS